jgi:phosphatidylinositol glycan class B
MQDKIPIRFLVLASAVALVLHFLAAWFSLGWQHPDEHFQVIEFTQYLFGNQSKEGLAWEFHAMMRPSFQVWFAYGLLYLGKIIGIGNPYHLGFILRLVMALMSMAGLWFFHNKLSFQNQKEARWHLLLCFLAWPLVFIHVRFSSESFSAVFLTLAMTLAMHEKRGFWTGVCLGCAFLARYQTGFFLAGFGLAFFLWEPWKWQRLAALAGGFASMFLMGTFLDYLFYGQWVCAPWNYLEQNIFKGVAASFGTEPWYWYFTTGAEKLIPPFSLLVLPGFLILPFLKKERLLGWGCGLFILGHALVGHKEWRFLFPLAPFLPLAVIRFIAFLRTWLPKLFANPRFVKIFIGLFVFQNCVCLLLVCFRPAHDLGLAWKFIYEKSDRPAVLWFEKKDPFKSGQNLASFYTVSELRRHRIPKRKPWKQNTFGMPVWVWVESEELAEFLESNGGKLEFSNLPSGIEYINFNGWLNRTSRYRIYRLP